MKTTEDYKRIPIISAHDHEAPDGIVYVGGSYLHGKLEEDARYDIYYILEKDLPKEIPLAKWYYGSSMSGWDDRWEVDPEDLQDYDLRTFAFDECVLKLEFNGKPCLGYYWTTHRPVYRSDNKKYLGEYYQLRGLVVYEDDEEGRKDAEKKMREKRYFL